MEITIANTRNAHLATFPANYRPPNLVERMKELVNQGQHIPFDTAAWRETLAWRDMNTFWGVSANTDLYASMFVA